MKIQSLSVLVPTKGCVNECKFCVSRMHENKYSCLVNWKEYYNEGVSTSESFRRAKMQFCKRLKFARDNKCNTVILTGTGEALQNKEFLDFFTKINQSLHDPFLWVELQTSGVMLTYENLCFLRGIQIDTISLSLSNIFNDKSNAEICGISDNLFFEIDNVCKKIKESGFNLRLSLNMTNAYDKYSPKDIIARSKELGADQITFRKLYFPKENKISSSKSLEIELWIHENRMNNEKYGDIKNFIKEEAVQLETLPFGAIKYSYDGMGIVWDDDCMSKEVKDTFKYLILREDCRLYSRWDDNGSLIF